MSRLLVVSSSAPFSGSVHRVVNATVHVVGYDYQHASPVHIISLLSDRLASLKVKSIAFLLQCNDTSYLLCSKEDVKLNLETVKNHNQVQTFLLDLRSFLAEESDGVHFFNAPTNLSLQSFEGLMSKLMGCQVELVTELFGPLSQQKTTELYFHIPQLQDLLQGKGLKLKVLDGYEKVRTVGKGAFGTAVLYRRLATQTLVVIKEINMMDITAVERQMALNEVQVLSSLHHPNIIRYLGSFEVDGVLMIEMEYADGGTLAQLISKSSRLSEQQVLTLFLQCVEAIQYMHQNNILHRDLKTANVFLTKDNLIKVGDFGISKVMSTKGQAQTVLGTPYYISPEMCEGKIYDTKSDIWALGCILYEMACLQKTFRGDNLPALVNKIMSGTFDPIPGVYTDGLKDLVNSLLQKDPALRPTGKELLFSVKQLLEKTGQRTTQPLYKRRERSVLYQVSGSGVTFFCKPTPLPPTVKILQVAVSSTHYIALSADKVVFTWGEGKRGQLGHPHAPMWLQDPTPVQDLADRSIAAVAAGDGFSVFLSHSGILMTCGDGTFGCLGHSDWNNTTSPKLIEKLLNEEVKKVVCGDHHTMALTSSGDVYIWGRGDCGRLGTGQEQDLCEPAKLKLAENITVKSLHCGPDSSAFITENGVVHAWGSNIYNKLGLTYSFFQTVGLKAKIEEKILVPQIVKTLRSWKIVELSLSTNHSAALTECGRVVTMGSNVEGQTGHHYAYPSVVADVEDKVAMSVTSGPTYTVMTSVENALYFWGTKYLNPESKGVDSTATLTLLHTEVALCPEEMLALYASPSQVARGEVLTVASVHGLWDTILVLVHTTVPCANTTPPVDSQEYDSIGPVPDWITAELAQAEHSWEQ